MLSTWRTLLLLLWHAVFWMIICGFPSYIHVSLQLASQMELQAILLRLRIEGVQIAVNGILIGLTTYRHTGVTTLVKTPVASANRFLT
jgi:hypothetical protein